MNQDDIVSKLRREASTILPPANAILLECAYEAESIPAASEFLLRAIERFNECAALGEALHSDAAEVYIRAESGENITLGIVPTETAEREVIVTSDLTPPNREFDAFVTELVLLDATIGAMCPLVLGIGIADTAEEAHDCARAALFRGADTHNNDYELASAEKRILARLSFAGPGAGGLGGRRTALSVAIERRGTGHIAISPGDYLTSYAKSF